MAAKRKTRMYEPWGYQDQNNYESTEIILENDLDGFFSGVEYKRDDNKIHFTNKDGEEVGTINVDDFVKSDSIIDHVDYHDGILTITFTNGDSVSIDLTELLDENEFKDGLIVDNHQVKVLVDDASERWLTVSENGVKVFGIQAEIDRLDDKIDDEASRATIAETALDNKITQETQDRIADVDAEENRAKASEQALDSKIDQEISDRLADVNDEENRAKAAEQVLTTNLSNEVTRATQTEQGLNHRVDVLNDELDAEESIRESNDAALGLRVTTEVNDRISAVNAEKTRAEEAETALNEKIDQEIARAMSAETSISERIDDIVSGDTPIKKLDELIDKLGYEDNDTLITNNPHEVAFGQWNISNTDANPSGNTVFSIGIGVSDDERKNAIEIREDGSVYMWIEDEFMNINKILGQISHEIY